MIGDVRCCEIDVECSGIDQTVLESRVKVADLKQGWGSAHATRRSRAFITLVIKPTSFNTESAPHELHQTSTLSAQFPLQLQQ